MPKFCVADMHRLPICSVSTVRARCQHHHMASTSTHIHNYIHCLLQRSGIGSALHSQAAAMAAALEMGRVFVEAPGHFLTGTPYCGASSTLDSCYFMPLSNCTFKSAGLTEQDLKAAPALTADNLATLHASNPASPRVVLIAGGAAYLVRALTPSLFKGILDSVGLPEARRYWWWRAQAIAYMLRPNSRTRTELAKRRKDKLQGVPLQEGCISLYVRHGDKGVEAKVWEDPAYDAAANQLRHIDSSLTRQVFLSTEDPATVEYFTSPARNWSTTYVKMKRK